MRSSNCADQHTHTTNFSYNQSSLPGATQMNAESQTSSPVNNQEPVVQQTDALFG